MFRALTGEVVFNNAGISTMSIFGKIRDAILGKKREASAANAPKPASVGKDAPSRPAQTAPNPAAKPAPASPQPMSEVDVEKQLDGMAGADRLNWRTSIVDLMKLIGLDASYEERKELAHELGRTDYSGTAEDNIWLHRKVMNELARNGGKVPAGLRD